MRVNAVMPSVIDTPANRASIRPKALEQAVPPADIASVIALPAERRRRWRSPVPSSPFTATPEPSPIRRLWEADGLPAFDLPEELARLYGGALGFDEPRLFANFVATIDGVVAIPSVPESNRLIAAGSSRPLRARAAARLRDVLVIGSGTLAASPRSTWTPAGAFPDAAAGFAALRRRLGRPSDPSWWCSARAAGSTRRIRP